MNDLIEGTFTRVPDDAWRDRLVSARDRMVKRTVPAFLEFCREVHAFRMDCDATQGGSEFSRLGREWLGVTQGQLSRWDHVGRRSDELMGAPISSPSSEDAICRIAQLGDTAFQKALQMLKPDMTQKAVRELVKALNPRPAPTETDAEAAIFRKRDRLYKQFQELPKKHQFVFGSLILDDLKQMGWKP